MHVQDGLTLKTHDDVPKDIREWLYAEEQQSLERHQKVTRTSTASHPPITIINVLPAPSYQTSHLGVFTSWISGFGHAFKICSN